MKSTILGPLLAILAAPAMASDLNLSLQNQAGANTLTLGPGRSAPYRIVGVLSDAASDGLAYFSTDVAFSGGALTQAANPASAPMNNFAPPLGLSNPAGFGGTLVGGVLKQLGGAQNTIRNTFAPVPIGNVISGVAQLGSPQLLATGSVTAPYTVGSYTLSASNLRANVLRTGQTGNPFWLVDKANAGTITNLAVEVRAISSRPALVSVQANMEHFMSIDAGPANAGRTFKMLGSFSGTAPGIVLPGGLTLPLHNDGYTDYTNNNPNTTLLQNSLGVLDANGRAVVVFRPTRRFIGLTVHHAFFLVGGPSVDFVSEADPVQVTN